MILHKGNHTYGNLKSIINEINNKELREDILAYFEKYEHDLTHCPASIKYHHNYTGGLIDHIVETYNIGSAIEHKLSKLFPGVELNRDYFIGAVSLHDHGKINEYFFANKSWKYKMSKEDGKKYDHATWVVNDFETFTNKKLPAELRHAILFHHGGWKEARDLKITINNIGQILSTLTVHSSNKLSFRVLASAYENFQKATTLDQKDENFEYIDSHMKKVFRAVNHEIQEAYENYSICNDLLDALVHTADLISSRLPEHLSKI